MSKSVEVSIARVPTGKKVHLSQQTNVVVGGRSACRYTSRPSIRAKVLTLADFLQAPPSLRCGECAKRAEELTTPQQVASMCPFHGFVPAGLECPECKASKP